MLDSKHGTAAQVPQEDAQENTHLSYIDLLLGRCLVELGIEVPGQVHALVLAHNSLVLQVTLVAHDDHGDLHREQSSQSAMSLLFL